MIALKNKYMLRLSVILGISLVTTLVLLGVSGSVRTQNAEKLIGWMGLLIPRSLTYEAACITL